MFKDIWSIVGSLSRLFDTLIGDHLIFQGDENVLDGGLGLPLLEQVQVFDSAIGLVDAGNVDFVHEGDLGRFYGVLGPAHNFQPVDAVVEDGLRETALTL